MTISLNYQLLFFPPTLDVFIAGTDILQPLRDRGVGQEVGEAHVRRVIGELTSVHAALSELR